MAGESEQRLLVALGGIIDVDEPLRCLVHAGRLIMKRLRCSLLLLRHFGVFIQWMLITKELDDEEMNLAMAG